MSEPLRVLEGGRGRYDRPPWLGRLVNVVLFLACVGALSIVLALVFLAVVLVG